MGRNEESKIGGDLAEWGGQQGPVRCRLITYPYTASAKAQSKEILNGTQGSARNSY